MRKVWTIQHGSEYMEMDTDGYVNRPQIGMKASGKWRITGAVERNNFGHVTARLTLADVKSACNSLNWKHKNGKQRIFVTDTDHGTAREWRSPGHSISSFVKAD